jgi:hypothetical protein
VNAKVLIVDDNEVNRQVASNILKKVGCKVTTVDNARDAISEVQKNAYDVVFMDIQMPGMDGVEATQKIKALPLKWVPPVVAMTAYSMEDDREKFLKKGLDDYISKPLRPDQLIHIIRLWLLKSKNKRPVLFKKRVENNHYDSSKLKVINLEVIEKLKKYGDDKLIQSVFQDFQKETKLQLEECTLSVKNNDYKDILDKLHIIKGNAGTLGVEKIAFQAKSIESKLRKNFYNSLEEDLDHLALSFLEFENTMVSIIQ